MSGPTELIPVCIGDAVEVLMQPRVYKVYDKLPAAARARLRRSMLHYSNGVDLPDSLFGWESRETVGDKKGTEAGVYAFKAKGVRVYGVPLTAGGDRKFVCSEIDKNKKQWKADPECLKRAALNVAPLVEEGWKP